MTWFIFAASSVFFFTMMNILQRKLAVKSEDPRATAVVFNMIAVGISLIVFFISGAYTKFSLPQDPTVWAVIIFACTMYGLFERGRFYVAQALDASVYAIVNNVTVIIAVIGAIFLYSEPLTLQKFLGIFLVLCSLIIISYEKKRKVPIQLKDIGLAVVVFTILGLAWMLDKKGALYLNAETYSIFVWVLPLLIIIFPLVPLRNIKREFEYGSWKVFLLAGANVVGYLLQLKAFEIGEATRVIPVVQTTNLVTVLVSIFLLKERENILKKIIAGTIGLIGVLLLV